MLGEFVQLINQAKLIGLDIETDGIDPYQNKILLITIGVGDSIFVLKDEEETLKKYILELIYYNKNLTVIGHNIKFDLKFIYHNYQILLTNVYDTQVCESVLNAGLESFYTSLGDLVYKYCNVKLDKTVRDRFINIKDSKDIDNSLLDYAKNDVKYLIDIYHKQIERAKELKLLRIFDLENKLVPVVALKEYLGIRINVEKWNQILPELRKQASELEIKIKTKILEDLSDKFEGKNLYQISQLLYIPVKKKSDIKALSQIVDISYSMKWLLDNINLSSPKQVLTILNLLDIPVVNTNEQTLQDYSNFEIISLLLEYRNLLKLITTYGENILEKINPITKALHPEFNQNGTATGRFSSSNPNCQNIPADNNFRSNFIARPGYKLITADYNQQEYRLAGALSKDKKIIEAYKNGHDIHTSTASIAYNVPIEQVTKEQRQNGKIINFLTLYGGSASKLHKVLGFSMQKSKEIIDAINSSYETSVTFRKMFGEKVFESGYSVTAYGRKRFYKKPTIYSSVEEFNQIKSQIMRQGYNALIQGTGADIVKLAMVECFYNNPFGIENFRIILQVHDEIVFEVKEEFIEEAAKFIKNTMEKVEQKFLGDIPAVVEISISDCWKK